MKHCDQVELLLHKQISSDEEVRDITATAKQVAAKWVNPNGLKIRWPPFEECL